MKFEYEIMDVVKITIVIKKMANEKLGVASVSAGRWRHR